MGDTTIQEDAILVPLQCFMNNITLRQISAMKYTWQLTLAKNMHENVEHYIIITNIDGRPTFSWAVYAPAENVQIMSGRTS